jgi:hypothetical protein
MHHRHNARVQLTATLVNNTALAFAVRGFIGPATSLQFDGAGRFIYGLIFWLSDLPLTLSAERYSRGLDYDLGPDARLGDMARGRFRDLRRCSVLAAPPRMTVTVALEK